MFWDEYGSDSEHVDKETKATSDQPLHLSEDELFLQQQRYYYAMYEAQHNGKSEDVMGRKRRPYHDEDIPTAFKIILLFCLVTYGGLFMVMKKLSQSSSDVVGYDDGPTNTGEYDYSQIRREVNEHDYGYDHYENTNNRYRKPNYGRGSAKYYGENSNNFARFNIWAIVTGYIWKLVAPYFTIWTIMGSVIVLMLLSAVYEYVEKLYRRLEKRIQQGPLYARPRYSTTNLLRKPEKQLLNIRFENPSNGPASLSVIEILEMIDVLDKERKQTECPTTRQLICSKIEKLENRWYEMLNDQGRFGRQTKYENLFNKSRPSTTLQFVDAYPGKRTYTSLLPPKNNKSLIPSSSIIPRTLITRQVPNEVPANGLIIHRHAARVFNEKTASFEDRANPLESIGLEIWSKDRLRRRCNGDKLKSEETKTEQ